VINWTSGIAMLSYSLHTVAEPDAVVANTNGLGFTVTTVARRLLRSCAADPVGASSLPPTYRFGFAEAIERDILTDSQVVVAGVDDATDPDWARRGQFVSIDGTGVTEALTLAGQIGLAKTMRRYDLHRTITFHSRVKRAQEFAESLPEGIARMPAGQGPNGQPWSDYASGEMPAGQHHVLLQHLRRLDHGERGVRANARCLAEMVDVPTLDGAAFIDPRQSEVNTVQAVGRAIRLAAEKTVGTIVIPVFIDTVDEPAIALDDAASKPVRDMIKALGAHDEELGEQLDELRRERDRQRQRPQLSDKIIFDLAARVGIDFAHVFDVHLVEQTAASWEFSFRVLQQFVEYNGHAHVPRSSTVDDYPLGVWVNGQRNNHPEGTLDANHQRRLQSPPSWAWDAQSAKWEQGFSRLLQYVERHGHASVPASSTVDSYPLGRWVNVQRVNYIKGKLDADRQHRLQNLTGWTWDARADQWEHGFSRLLQYFERHGHARVPWSSTVYGYPLGEWVKKQRNNHAKGTLAADRRRRLQNVPGWTWKASSST
jgi:helicase associated protein